MHITSSKANFNGWAGYYPNCWKKKKIGCPTPSTGFIIPQSYCHNWGLYHVIPFYPSFRHIQHIVSQELRSESPRSWDCSKRQRKWSYGRNTSAIFKIPTSPSPYKSTVPQILSLVNIYKSWTYMELRQNSGMDRPAVIQTYGSVWITWVLVWIGGMDRPVGSGYGSGLYILTRSHIINQEKLTLF